MPDNKNKTDNRDRMKVAGGQNYEVQYLTEQTGITPDQARELIKAYGNDRQTLIKAARSLRREPEYGHRECKNGGSKEQARNRGARTARAFAFRELN